VSGERDGGVEERHDGSSLGCGMEATGHSKHEEARTPLTCNAHGHHKEVGDGVLKPNGL